jgi:hypothetical protein
MGFNRRKLEDQRRQAAAKEAAGRRATDAQVLEDAEDLIAAWNERQTKRMPMLFSPTIGAAVTAGYSSSQCGSDGPHSCPVMPVLPAEPAICRTRAAVTDQHRR